MKRSTGRKCLLCMLVLAAVLLLTAAASAASGGECGEGTRYTLDDSGVLTVSGTGAITDTPWEGQEAAVQKLVVEEGVTSICSGAFSGCTNLTAVRLPDSLTTINSGAFRECESLGAISVPAGVTKIGNYVFSSCDALRKIVFENKTTVEYGDNIFHSYVSPKPTIYCYARTGVDTWATKNGFEIVYLQAPAPVIVSGDLRLPVGAKASVQVAGYRAAYDISAVWASSDPSVASVDGGVVTALKKGKAEITASWEGGSDSVQVEVYNVAASISFTKKEYWIATGDVKEYDIQIDPADSEEEEYTFSVSDPETVKLKNSYVDGRARVEALKPGEVTLTCTGPNGLRAECKLHVTARVMWIGFTEKEAVLRVGDTHQFTVTVTTEDQKEYSNELVTFASDSYYLEVDENGLATAKSDWDTYVRASAGDISVQIPVLVCPADGGNRCCLGNTATMDLTLNGDPDTACTSYYPEIVSVDSFEKIPGSFYGYRVTYTGRSPGISMVKVHDQMKFTHWFFVNVTEHEKVIQPRIEPTYEKPGWTEGAYCEHCGKTLVEQQEIPVKKRPGTATVGGGKYKLNHTAGTAVYTGPAKKTVTKVTIPDTVTAYEMTYKVTEIAAGACKKLANLQKVSVGKHVEKIGKNAFNACPKLASVSGGDGVTAVGASAFASCAKLSTLPVFAKLKEIGASAFRACVSLKKITLSAKVAGIGRLAFDGCVRLKEILIKTKLLKASAVGANAFRNIYKKAAVTCPKGKAKAYEKLLRGKGIPAGATFK